MNWIVEYLENNNVLKIRKELSKQNINYLLIKINNNEIIVLDKDLLIPLENSNHILKTFIKNNKVFCYGSKDFSNVLHKKYPHLSCQDNLLDCQYLIYYFGSKHVLNPDMEVSDLFLLKPKVNKFFIRPLGNNKIINGMVMNKQQLEELKEIEKKKLTSRFLNKPLIISSLKEIKEEYRFFVYHKQIIASSSYRPMMGLPISNELREFTEKMIKKFPLEHYVIDIAVLPNGEYKVIELNNINTSGLYEINVEDLVKSIK